MRYKCWFLPGHSAGEARRAAFNNAAAERDIEIVWLTLDDFVWSPEGLKGVELPDFAISYICPHHVQKVVEMMGVPVFNALTCISNASDKLSTTELLWEADVRQPKTVVIPKEASTTWDEDEIRAHMRPIVEFFGGYPFVIKTATGSMGSGVFLIEGEQDLIACEGFQRPRALLAQAFVPSSYGTDIRVFVVGGRAIGAFRRVGAEGDFRSNISQGGHSEDHEMTPAEADLAERASAALGMDWCAVDILIGESGEPIVCEINSTPQFSSNIERAPHLDIPSFYFDYILAVLAGNREREHQAQ